MDGQQGKGPSQHANRDPRLITKWARRYAQHRTIPLLVFQAFFILFAVAIGVSSYLTALAYRAGRMVGFWIFLAVLAAVVTALIWFCVRGDKLIETLSKRVYQKEGTASSEAPPTKKQRRLYHATALGLLLCALAHIVFGMLGYLPLKYMQPISAVYCLPFMGLMAMSQRRKFGPLISLWPILYGLHAILIVAGVPILFKGVWFGFNMLIPVAGYGMVAALASHVYSRFAFRKLKELAQVPPEGGPGEGEDDGRSP